MAFSDLDHVKSRWLAWPFWVAGLERLVMFRSSLAAFYSLARRHFYGRGSFHRGRLKIHVMRLHVRSEVKKLVYRHLLSAHPALAGQQW
jgi:hypothetical protein